MRALRTTIGAARRVRFALWAARLRARLRRHGMRLVFDAPHGARWHALPSLASTRAGAEAGR